MVDRPEYRSDPEGVPAPTQIRADLVKARSHGTGPDDVPAQLPPQNIDIPLVMGTAEVGASLTCTMGNWTGEPTGYAYSWHADGSPVSTAGPDYIVAAGDAGKSIVCIVTATNAHGSTQAPPSNAVTIP